MKTNLYNVIKIDDNLSVVVDKEAEAYPYAYLHKKNEIIKIGGVGEKSGELHHSKGFSYKDEAWKILATIGSKRLEGIPIIDIDNEVGIIPISVELEMKCGCGANGELYSHKMGCPAKDNTDMRVKITNPSNNSITPISIKY